LPNFIWLNEFLPEIDNVRSALEWALRSARDDDVLLAGQIAGSFRGLWLIPGSFHECRRWMTLVLGRIDEAEQPLVVVDLLTALSQTLAGSQMFAVYGRLIDLFRHLDDRVRLAGNCVNWQANIARAVSSRRRRTRSLKHTRFSLSNACWSCRPSNWIRSRRACWSRAASFAPRGDNSPRRARVSMKTLVTTKRSGT
jgi:hypothetical protein